MTTQPSLFTAEKIAAHCPAVSHLMTFEAVAQTGSTNADLLARLAGLAGPTMLVAETQTAGRGRAGRSWLSAAGSSLTFSLAWPFSQSPQALLGLPLAVGVALAEALQSLNVAVQLKWPNDVLKDGKKLAGVLIETAQHANQTWAVIGIGLNLVMSDELEEQIGRPVADAMWLAQMERNQLLAVLINHLIACLQPFSVTGFSTFMPAWNAFHAYTGQQVNIIDQGEIRQQGMAMGVDSSGCLLLQDQHGRVQTVLAGDVSLRLS